MVSSAIMLLMDTDYVCDHLKLRAAVQDIASKGFDAVCLEFRNCIFSEFDAEGADAIRVISDMATALGLKVIKTLPWPGIHTPGRILHARQQWIHEYRTVASDGAFNFILKTFDSVDSCRTSPSFREICRVFFIVRNGDTLARVEDITATTTIETSVEVDIEVRGSCNRNGELLVFARYGTDTLDMAYDGMHVILDEMFDLAKDLPVSGFALDEFGAGSRRQDLYNAGTCFLREFRRKYGYDLLDKAYLLNNTVQDECGGKVRHDYYSLTVDHTHQVQAYLKQKFTEFFGKEIFIGYHHTWWGEGNSGDLWAGNIDYFRLTEVLSGGFVDAQYDAERTMISMTMLAESLAKYSDSGIAYNMCWDRHPTHEKMDYYHRMMAVRNARWVAHAYGRSGCFGPGFPEHDTWHDVRTCVKMEQMFQQFIGAAVTHPRVAMLYLWESLAYANNEQMHYHRLGMKALLEKFMHSHIEIDVIPSSEGNFDKYDTLIVPWPVMMPEQIWRAVKAFASEGKRIIFTGPSAECTTEGRDISLEFNDLVGARPLHPVEFAGEYEYVTWDLWFTDKKIPMICTPLEPAAADILISSDQGLLAVRHLNIEYYAFEIALTHYFEAVLESMKEYRELELPADIISKVSYGDGYTVIALAARWSTRLNTSFVYNGNRIDLANGTIAGIKIRDGQIAEVIGNEGMELHINEDPCYGKMSF